MEGLTRIVTTVAVGADEEQAATTMGFGSGRVRDRGHRDRGRIAMVIMTPMTIKLLSPALDPAAMDASKQQQAPPSEFEGLGREGGFAVLQDQAAADAQQRGR